MNRLNRKLRTYILHALLEGVSIRSCERIFGVSQNTILKLLADAGDAAIAHLASIEGLAIQKIQADELFSYVAAREFNVADMVVPTDGAGRVWTYLAICADTKLVIAYHLGDQTEVDATTFTRRLASKLKRDEDGKFQVKPTIITDGLHAYPAAIEAAFGSDVNFGVLSKQYSGIDEDGNRLPNSRYRGADRKVVVGEVNERDISTSYIERQNLNVRMGNRRYGRRTNAFSKTMLNHERQLALWIMYHNYCWVPRPRRPRKGEPWPKRPTAALEAGITDRLWEVGDILAFTDAFIAARRAADAFAEDPEPAPTVWEDIDLAPSHWVYRRFHPHSAKVHQAGCVNCRDGAGKGGAGSTKSGDWHPFYSLEDARAAAQAMLPDHYSVCSMCIGEYRLGGRDA